MVKKFLLFFVLILSVSSLHAQTVAYITNTNSNNVSVINTSTNTVTTTFGVSSFANGVVCSPDGARAYVTVGDGTVSVIDTATNTVVTTISLPAGAVIPAFPAVTPDGKILYVPDFATGVVLVISTATNSVIATIAGGNDPYAVVVTPDGGHAYALGIQTVSVIDTGSNAIVQSITVDSVPEIALFPVLAIAPGGGSVYVGGEQSPPVVQVISTASNAIVATIPVPGSADGGLGVTPDGSRVYVADFNNNVVDIIDTATNTLEPTTIPAGVFPNGVGVTPDGASLYVVNGLGDSVSVISTANNSTVATIPVGIGPTAVAITHLNAPFASFPTPQTANNPNRISLSGRLSLGANTSGLDFAHQPMTLTVGGFSLLFPAGTVTQVDHSAKQHFTFSGTLKDLSVTFDLIGNSPNFSYSFTIMGKNVDAQVGPNPVAVTLAIGTNSGSTTVNF